MQVLAIYNLKGGVGKTAASVNLAHIAAQANIPTLLWDLDPQGASSWYFGQETGLKGMGKGLIKGKTPLAEFIHHTQFDNLDIIPANLENHQIEHWLKKSEKPRKQLRKLIEPLHEDYSLLILDCPPGYSLLAENIMHAADLIACPIIPTFLSIRTYAQIVGHQARAKIKDVKLHPFLSMIDRRRKLHRELEKDLPVMIKTLLPVSIPYASVIEQMGEKRLPVTAFAHSSDAAQAYIDLWQEIQKRLLKA
jgi:cellulose biosynthesis protein BcsQ